MWTRLEQVPVPILLSFLAVVFVLILVAVKISQGLGRPIEALDATKYKPFRLLAKENVNHNTMLFKFALPSAKHKLGLPVGKHMSLKFVAEDDKEVIRQYTPVTSDDTLGSFDLLIKIYPNGKMSQHLKNLAIGDSIAIKGPLGSLSYRGHGGFTVRRAPAPALPERFDVKNIGMIAGGSGLTPMLQIIREIAKRSDDNTICRFIFANVTEEDILLRKELESIMERRSNINIYFTLDKPPAGWKQGAGYVNVDMIKAQLPPPGDDTMILVCGPPPMCKMLDSILTTAKYPPHRTYIY